MNFFKSFFVLVFLFVNSTLLSQANLLNAVIPQEIGQLNEQQLATSDNEPLAYGYVDDRDVMWSKTVWEKIDLDERINFPYYYPVENVSPHRKPLFDVLTENIINGNITEVYTSPYFTDKMSIQDVQDGLFAQVMTDLGVEKANNGEPLTDEDYLTTNLTSFDIEVLVDGVQNSVTPWTGSLPTYNLTTVTLPTITGITASANVEIKTSNPNGGADDRRVFDA